MQKKIAILFVGIIFCLALIPALYPADYDAQLRDSSIYRAYNQLYTVFNMTLDLDHRLCWTKNSPTLKISLIFPNDLNASAENRAPPT